MTLSLGLSPCPNDTYIFANMLQGRVGTEGLGYRPYFADVEELNRLALGGRLDVTKISAAAAGAVMDEYVILDSGGALGRGCGPLLVSLSSSSVDALRKAPLAVPGLMTTANLLLTLHGGFVGPRLEMVFDAVMPSILAGESSAGVIIHESRFTYAERGLKLVMDLGAWWEESTGAPIPLGVIVARRSLGRDTLVRLQAVIRSSLEQANRRPAEVMPFVRSHAQEMDEAVLKKHIAMFVNEYSLSLGPDGRDGVGRLVEAAAAVRGQHPSREAMFVDGAA